MKTTIAIPCIWDHFCFLDRALSRIMVGTVVPDEVVVVISMVDNGNKLHGINVLKKRFGGFFDLKIEHFSQQLLTPDTREKLTNYITGDLILYHDADDTQHSQRVEVVKKFFEERDIVHLCHSYQFSYEGEAGQVDINNAQTFSSQLLYDKYFVRGEMPKAFGAAFMRTMASALCIRREVLDKISWKGLAHRCEDREFCLQTLREFNKTLLVNLPLLNYFVGNTR